MLVTSGTLYTRSAGKRLVSGRCKESNSPFLSPYDRMTAPHFTSPSFHGPLSTTTPKQKTETTLKTVVNLSDAVLSPTELEVLNLGLKFVPTPKQDPTAQLAPLIQNVVKRLPDGMESSAIHQTTTILADYNPKQDKTPDNLTPKQRAALKSLMKKRSQLRFLPADKGNATVILNDQQYIDKVEEHIESSGCYTILNKDPTTPIHDKLYRILLKFKKEGKINSETMRNMRQLHPRWPQLYGQPKIHKLGAPIRPVVSFYNTPLSALHKVLAHYLKPFSQQLHPPQRHQRLQTTPQYYWTSQLPLPHFLGHQIPLHLL